MRTDTAPWWRQAEADLGSGELLMRVGGEAYAVSWFAQQAAEKALKALFIEQRAAGAQPPKTHNLLGLGSSVGAASTILADLIALAPVFDRVRYPDSNGVAPVDLVQHADAQNHLDAARRVSRWVGQQL